MREVESSLTLVEYLARHDDDDDITTAIDAAIDECGQPSDAALQTAALATLRRVEW